MFSQIEVAKPKVSHFNGRLFSSLKKSAIKGLHKLDVAFLIAAMYLFM